MAAPPAGWEPVDEPSGWEPVDEHAGDPLDENALSTFVRHTASQLNPMNAVRAISRAVTPEAVARYAGVDDAHAKEYGPINTIKNLGAAQGALFDKAKAAYDKGDYGTAARHFLDYLLPIVGPQIDQSADEAQQGKIAASAGDAVGLGLTMFGPEAIAARGAKLPKIADWAEQQATRKTADVITPKSGPNKVRLGNRAQTIAPQLIRKTSGLTRSGLADEAATGLENAGSDIDAAADARLNARTFDTSPVLAALRGKKRALTAEAVDASEPERRTITRESPILDASGRPATSTTQEEVPLGEDVVPEPNASRAAPIDRAISEVERLGPVANYEPLRRIRAAYDQPARVRYNPATSPDFLAAQGGAQGAADVAGAIRDHLAAIDPETAAANKDYAFWKSASDVLNAAEEADRARPRIGRNIASRAAGAAIGAAGAGKLGAAVGAVLGPVVDSGIQNLTPAIKIGTARQLAAIADALRSGKPTQAQLLLSGLSKKLRPAMISSAGLEPAPFQLAPAAAEGQEPRSRQ